MNLQVHIDTVSNTAFYQQCLPTLDKVLSFGAKSLLYAGVMNLGFRIAQKNCTSADVYRKVITPAQNKL